jgi:hypothetical protein
MTTLLQDLRYSLRMLVGNPLFTAVAVATLALGIGANTVVFTGAYWVLFEPLPYSEADKLAVLYQIDKTGAETGIPYGDFVEWKASRDLFLLAGATRTQTTTLEGRDQAERVTAGIVSSEVMPMLGGRALLGRTFGRADFRPGADATVVVGHAFWRSRFGGASDVVGRRVTLDGRDVTVIGVMPAGFSYPFRAEIWLPLERRATRCSLVFSLESIWRRRLPGRSCSHVGCPREARLSRVSWP